MQQLDQQQLDLVYNSELDLDAVIADHWFPETMTLDLGGAVKEADFNEVLERIRGFEFYHEIENLILKSNQFVHSFNSETFETSEFPPNLRVLDLSDNMFLGTGVPWRYLPRKLEALYLQNNRFSGEIDWHSINKPPKLRTLWIFGSGFEGVIEWSKLPATLDSLYTSKKLADASFGKKAPKELVDASKSMVDLTGWTPKYRDAEKTLFTKSWFLPQSRFVYSVEDFSWSDWRVRGVIWFAILTIFGLIVKDDFYPTN